MSITQLKPAFRGGGNPVPAVALSGQTVRAGHFVKIAGAKDANGNYQVQEAAAGDKAFGVAEYDFDVSNGKRGSVSRIPSIARVVPGAAITAGAAVQSDSQGRAITLASAIAALLDTGVVGNNNAIEWTAAVGGVGGNAITVAITNPGGTVAAEVVTVVGNAISVAARTSTGAITSTAAQIIAAVLAHGEASDLIAIKNQSTSTGAGVVVAFAATNLAGGSDPEGGAHVAGYAANTCASDAAFVEIAL